MTEKIFAIYIVTNPRNTVLYTGVTSNLAKRVFEHKNKTVPGFTKRYNCTKLVYFETTTDSLSALEREKQIKKYGRKKKIELISEQNPDWTDLSEQLC